MEIVFFICVAILLIVIVTYNKLVSVKNAMENANGAVDTMLKKRYDLLPNLIAITNNYMSYEKNLLQEVSNLSMKRLDSNIPDDKKNEIDNKVEQSINKALSLVENHPDIKADRIFLNLEASWNECEEQIAAARRAYNSAVASYNNAFERYPGSMFAKTMKFEHKSVLTIPVEEQGNIRIS